MSIQVTCPNGHDLKVKDKYAGKTGRCPFCHEKVLVPKRSGGLSDEDALGMLGDYEPPKPKPLPPLDEPEPQEEQQGHVLDDHPDDHFGQSSGLSLLGSSIVRHQKTCPACGTTMDHWFASCKKCGHFFND